MANLIRTARAWFFDSVSGPNGDKFNTGNKPTKATFKALVDTSLNPAEAADTATTAAAGHIKLATDAMSYNRINLWEGVDDTGVIVPPTDNALAGMHNVGVSPYQLPNLVVDDGTEATLSETVTSGGISITPLVHLVGSFLRKNFKIALHLWGSLKITDTALGLDGDEETPAAGKFYGMLSNQKGWYAVPTDLPSMNSNTEGQVLYSDGNGASYWDDPAAGSGSGGGSVTAPVDGISIKYNSNADLSVFVAASTRAAEPPGPSDLRVANVLGYVSAGLYVKINPATLGVDAYGCLTVKSGTVTTDKVQYSDDFLAPSPTNDLVWEKVNSGIETTVHNGIMLLDAVTYASASLTSVFKVTPALNPILTVSFIVRKQLANVPVVRLGLQGDGTTDFIGIVLTANDTWMPVLENNGVDVTMTTHALPIDQTYFHTLAIQLCSDNSAILYIDDVVLGSVEAGQVDFSGDLKVYASIAQTSSVDADMSLDYVTLSYDRSTNAFTYSAP